MAGRLLSSREEKVLRYLASTENLPVNPSRVVIKHPDWTDLPTSYIAAYTCLIRLEDDYGMAVTQDGINFFPTEKGKKYIITHKHRG